MHRFVLILIAGTLALASLVGPLASSVVTAHQEVSVTAPHPVVGAWYWQNISADPFDDSFAVFHGDGTYVEETPYIGAGIGAWQVTGDRSADLVIVFQDLDGGLDPQKPTAFVPGVMKMWLSLEVSDDGNHLTATGPVEARHPDGALEYAYDFNGTASRLEFDSGKPVASPVASPEDAETATKIDNAMSAAPSAISATATILDNVLDETGAFVVLRESTSEWSCFPDVPTTPGNDPACYDQAWLAWNYAFVAGEDPSTTMPGFAYMLQGGSDASNTDPFATEPAAGEDWVNSGPHIMLLLPGDLDQAAFSTDHDAGGPYVMWAGTPYEHIMMPVADGEMGEMAEATPSA